MTTTEADAVLAANAAFYRAMATGNLGSMKRLWSRRRAISCTHPGSQVISGRPAIMESWRRLLVENEPPAILFADACATICGGTALVLCRELLEGGEFIATNVFVRETQGWAMVGHQAAAVPRH